MQRPSNRSYSLRGNRMTRAQTLAINQHWQDFGLEVEEELNLHNLFPDKDMVILEIGSGMGEATAEIAQASSEVGYVAVEMHQPGLAALILLILEKQLSNIKLIREDATYLLANFIADNSVDGIHLPNGFIHIATDWQPYANWIKVRFDANSSFTGGVVARPSWRVLSKFEGQGLKKGHSVTDFRYIKN